MSEPKKPKIKSRNPVIQFDRLQMFFGEPYVINLENVQGSLTVNIPSIIDIIKIGYSDFFSSLNIFTTNTTAYRLILWKNKIDWNTFSDFNLFIMLYKNIDPVVSKLLFDGLDFTEFEIATKTKDGNETQILYHQEKQIEINEMVYFHFSQYLRRAFNNAPEEKITKDSLLKKMYITKDEKHLEAMEHNRENEIAPEENFLALISSCINHPGFKYNLEQLREINICQFFDSVSRLQIYESSTALLKGMYSGFISGKDIDPDSYNFMRSVN